MEADLDEPATMAIWTHHDRQLPDAEGLQAAAAPDPKMPEQDDFHSEAGEIHTLYHAVVASQDKGATAVFNRLWRLLMWLRHWGGGADRLWLPNPRNFRRASSKLSWFQHLSLFCYVLFFFTDLTCSASFGFLWNMRALQNSTGFTNV